MRSVLQKVAVTLLALACLYSLVHYWISVRSLNTITTGNQAVENWEARLEPVKQALPIKRGIVGYVVEWDVPGVKYAFGDLETEYFLSQYALAPLILVQGAKAEWNVAILKPDEIKIWERIYQGKFDVTCLKNNVYLLHRRGAP
ncbi:MAG TPA: hypothetical protein VMT73_10045 [Anaerolineales bacterium]|nr:hypothetical protein [Anaerolineales bacterium]